ncbi:MAG: cation-transporting P-type ATPase [Clostridia bacterium]|nr:cation-transporting P-type ATPase [Clostridia bacterium]
MENKQWFDKSLTDVYTELESSPAGLSQRAARRRYRRGDGLLTQKRESILSLCLGVLSDFSPVLLILFTILAVVMETGEGAGVVIGITVFYMIASALLSIRSQAIIEGMCGQRVPRVQVQRGGKVFYILSGDVVRGDIILLSEGDVIPADCRLISANDLFVHEGGVTGNAFSVPKFAVTDENFKPKKPEDMSNMLFALSKITHGNARAIAVDTGRDTYVVRTRGENKLPVAGKLKILKVLSEYARISSLVIPALAFILILVDIIVPPHTSIYAAFMWGFSLAAGSVSQLFNLLGRGAAAVAIRSAAKDSRGGAVVTDLGALEKIRNTDTVVFSVESAVLTEESRVVSLYHNNSEHDPYFPDGEGGREMLGRAAAIINSLENKLAVSGEGGRAPMLRAVINCAIAQGADSSLYPVLDSRMRSGDSRFNTALFAAEGEFVAASLAEAAEILPYCSECIVGGKRAPMSQLVYANALQVISSAESKARTVFALAEKKTGYNNLHRTTALQTDLTLVGFIIVERELSPTFYKVMNAIVESGITPIMFTSENSNPTTAKNLALYLGIAENDSEIITGKEISGMSDKALDERINGVRAVLCVGGDERTRIVYSLERNGKRVAYMGAETCDVAAATAATVSFGCAMTGRRRRMEVLSRDTDRYGSQVLKMISHVTVQRAQKKRGGLGAYYNTLISAESCFHNIRSAVKYLITMQMMRIAVCLLGICTGTVALSAVQVLVSGLVFDLFAVAAFCEKKDRDISRKKPKEWHYLSKLKKVMPFALIFGAATVILPFAAVRFGAMPQESFSSVVFASLILSQIALHAHYACSGCIVSPYEWWGGVPSGLFYILVLSFLFAAIVIEPFGTIFGILPDSPRDMLYSFIVPLLLLITMEINKYIRSASEKTVSEEKT